MNLPLGALHVLAHKEKEVTNALEGAGNQTQYVQTQEVKLMSQPNMYRLGINVTRLSLKLEITGRIEMVGNWKAKVYDMLNVMMENEIQRTEEADSSQRNCVEEAQVGMVFESEEVARAFYNVYAMRMGFTTRVLSSRKSERDGSLISRGLGCRMSPPTPNSDHLDSDKAAIKQRDHKRDLCTAMILIKKEKPGRWVVARFVKEHNHPLVASLPQGCAPLDWKDRKIQELTAELRAKKKLSATYRDQLLSLVNDVENQNGHLSKRVHLVLKNLTELESKGK